MPTSYNVDVDTALRRVVITFSGMYAEAEMDGFDRDLKAAALRVRKTSPYFDLLVDFREAPVMPKDTAEAGAGRIQWCIDNGVRKSANVTSSAIMKMQLQRLAGDPRFCSFTSPEAAIEWLESDD